jgi:organic hydroperoxide reductase OsmC/OhrA
LPSSTTPTNPLESVGRVLSALSRLTRTPFGGWVKYRIVFSEPMTSPESLTSLTQVERYEFKVEFAEESFPGITVDEPPPVGSDHGPNPVQSLAMAVGHCMSSTLVSTLDRARVRVSPIRTVVRATVGLNEQGRRRVQHLQVEIFTQPVDEGDRGRFEQCVKVFPDFCTVSGAVRDGIPIDHRVGPG